MNQFQGYTVAILRFFLMWGAISALIKAMEILSPRIFAAAYPNIPAPPPAPITAALITAFLSGLAAVKLYVSHTDPKDWGHPAHLIDEVYRKSSVWEPFMRNDKEGVQ